MNTPVWDFVKKYRAVSPARLHMPGHKGSGPLGIEDLDITEIEGADVLYRETGILGESQRNASALFGTEKTLYSTEGSTLCIRAILALVKMYAGEKNEDVKILASRNAHKSFITGCALLDIDPIWLYPNKASSQLSCNISAEDLNLYLEDNAAPTALYITSPDYLGNISDIASISKICHENKILLIVDNAHGAYLHFLPEPQHPIDLGADLVCDSAHKTLPVITGGAYLHISKHAPKFLSNKAADAMSLFASTSPSYLILESLDLCNKYLSVSYSEKLHSFSVKVHETKKEIKALGFSVIGNEPLKITIQAKESGYTGHELSSLLAKENIHCEFSDPDYLVMMLSPENTPKTLVLIKEAFSKIPTKDPILQFPPKVPKLNKNIPPRNALFSSTEELPIDQCLGRILSQATISCPPAIPIAISGEEITKDHIESFRYYGIKKISVIK